MVAGTGLSGGEGRVSKYRRHKRKDANHSETVTFLRASGAVVDDVSALPDIGYDLLVCYQGNVAMVEIKDGEQPPSARRLTESEKEARLRHGDKFAVVTNLQEAGGLLASMAEHRPDEVRVK